jgi:hypothetical protein
MILQSFPVADRKHLSGAVVELVAPFQVAPY